MKKLFTRFTAILSTTVLCFFPPKPIQSCGPGIAPDEDRFCLFNPQTHQDNAMEGFNYSDYGFNYFKVDPDSLDWKKNCQEWIAFSKNSFEFSAVYNVQYNMSPDKFLWSFSNNRLKDRRDNSFIRWMTQAENKAALEYMALAKRVESTQVNVDPWDTTYFDHEKLMIALAYQADAMTRSASITFLKERYAFQAIKMYCYGGEKKSAGRAKELYNQYLKNSTSIVSKWVLVYLAKMEENSIARTRLLLKAFDETEEKKMYANLILGERDLDRFMEAHHTRHEAVIALTLKGIKTPGKALPILKKITVLEPGSKYLPLLISREINKLENWISSYDYLGFLHASNYERWGPYSSAAFQAGRDSDLKYLHQVANYVLSLPKVNNGDFFLPLAQAHLLNMQSDHVQARSILNSKSLRSNKAAKVQVLIEKFIILYNTENIMSAQVKSKLAELFHELLVLKPALGKHLKGNGNDTFDESFRNENEDDLAELLLMLSKKYERLGDLLTAALLYNKADILKNNYDNSYYGKNNYYEKIAYLDRQNKPELIDGLLALKHKQNKTAFEKFICPEKWGKDDQYKDLKGTILIRTKDYKGALTIFNSISSDYWSTEYEFKDYLPLSAISRTNELDVIEDRKAKTYKYVSKKLITAEIVGLQARLSNAATPEIRADALFQLANASFNISYWGKGWMLFSYGRSWNELNEFREEYGWDWPFFKFKPNAKRYARDYYTLEEAKRLYKSAYDLSKNAELKAKCLLALADCERCAQRAFQEVRLAKQPDLRAKYIADLRKKFTNTRTYKMAAIHCPDVAP